MNLALESFNNLPRVTRWLAVSFFAGWLLELAFGPVLNVYFGLVPQLTAGQYWFWQPLTYIFIHAGFWHFLFNAFMLWMLGRFLEPIMGSARFLRFFLFCGVAAGLFTVLISPRSVIPVIGASGAIYGLLAAFAFYYPDMKVYLYFIFPLTARQLALALGVLEFTLSLAVPGSKIANVTHLSGLIFGWLYLKAGTLDPTTCFKSKICLRQIIPPPAAGGGISRWWGEMPQWPWAKKDKIESERNETDALLEKISKKGLGSLSKSEIEKLSRYSRGGNA
ncbi:MAG: rhomboid family intramembrane serine protease [Elusimicrobia bacterium]|nr:rhomboid family intramembrane serine protease [Elusimicrobiota bacterium]